ncbi:MAG: hypothetical protein M1826_007349 [Phylliscum demangeonii]|nr:MAG: hypothetical protein M1826_007349 [Phylliscum demangeonii]
MASRPSSAWSADDDRRLKSERARNRGWNLIQRNYFPHKTPNACRKRHERLMERENEEDWDHEKFEQLAHHYVNLRKEIWSPLATRVGENWKTVESRCMEKGLKNIQTAARSFQRKAPRPYLDQSAAVIPYDEQGNWTSLQPGILQTNFAPHLSEYDQGLNCDSGIEVTGDLLETGPGNG